MSGLPEKITWAEIPYPLKSLWADPAPVSFGEVKGRSTVCIKLKKRKLLNKTFGHTQSCGELQRRVENGDKLRRNDQTSNGIDVPHVWDQQERRAWRDLLGDEVVDRIISGGWNAADAADITHFLSTLEKEVRTAFTEPLLISFLIERTQGKAQKTVCSLRWLAITPSGLLSAWERNSTDDALVFNTAFFRNVPFGRRTPQQRRFMCSLSMLRRYCVNESKSSKDRGHRLRAGESSLETVEIRQAAGTSERHRNACFWTKESWHFSNQNLWQFEDFAKANSNERLHFALSGPTMKKQTLSLNDKAASTATVKSPIGQNKASGR